MNYNKKLKKLKKQSEELKKQIKITNESLRQNFLKIDALVMS